MAINATVSEDGNSLSGIFTSTDGSCTTVGTWTGTKQAFIADISEIWDVTTTVTSTDCADFYVGETETDVMTSTQTGYDITMISQNVGPSNPGTGYIAGNLFAVVIETETDYFNVVGTVSADGTTATGTVTREGECPVEQTFTTTKR